MSGELATLAEQISCVRREIAVRESVYRRRVADGKMKQAAADKEIAHMTAVLHTLQGLVDGCAQAQKEADNELS